MGRKSSDKRRTVGYWEALKESLGITPQTVQGQGNLTTEYYFWRLLNTVKGLFEIECPSTWDKDYMLDVLLLEGYFAVLDTYYGVLPLRCGLTGVNVFNRPNGITVANHDKHISNQRRSIGEDCEIVSLHGSGYRRGIAHILQIYAQMLASCDSAIDVNLINSKTAHVFGAKDQKEAESLKDMYDEITSGKPGVFVKSRIAELADTSFFKADVKQNFVAPDIQMTKRKIMEEFLTIFGVNNANTDKRERLNSEEVNSNNMELLANTAYWNKNLREACDRVNAMFPSTNLSITMPFREIEELRCEMLIDTLRNSSDSEQKEADDEENNS